MLLLQQGIQATHDAVLAKIVLQWAKNYGAVIAPGQAAIHATSPMLRMSYQVALSLTVPLLDFP